jgi:hypothetical protein
MKLRFAFGLITLILLVACSSAAPAGTPQTISVQYTFAATAWLETLNTCAGNNIVSPELRAADFIDVSSAMLAIRIGQPAGLTTPSYQIGTEEILVVVNKQNPINRLTADQVRGLFSGQIPTWKNITGSDAPVQAWVFPGGEDVQQLFEQTALGEAPVSSGARLAANPDEMAQAIAADVNAIGILPRHWKAGNVSDVYSVASVPVLALVPTQPDNAMTQILACLQK